MLRWIVGATVVVVAAAGFAVPAYAGGARSFVSGGGSDVGTCERTAPCRTFGYAITQTNAGGEIVALDSSGYGPVTITKSISLIAPRGVHAGISPSSGNAITIAAGTGDQVVLRNLHLNGANGAFDGIHYTSGRSLTVEDCVIAGFSDAGIVHFVNSTSDARLTVTGTILRGNGDGLFVSDQGTGAINVQIDHSHADGGSGGFAIGDGTRATISDSVAAHNSGDGLIVGSLAGRQAQLFMERDTATDNAIGIFGNGAQAAAIVWDSAIVANTTGVSTTNGAHLFTRLDNTLAGNGTNGMFTDTFAAAYKAH